MYDFIMTFKDFDEAWNTLNNLGYCICDEEANIKCFCPERINADLKIVVKEAVYDIDDNPFTPAEYLPGYHVAISLQDYDATIIQELSQCWAARERGDLSLMFIKPGTPIAQLNYCIHPVFAGTETPFRSQTIIQVPNAS